MPNKSDPMAAREVSNKEVGEFTREKIAHMNKIPESNTRKSSGVDRGKYVNHDMQVEGCGEFDVYIKPKMENN